MMFSKQFAICCINEVQYTATGTCVGNLFQEHSNIPLNYIDYLIISNNGREIGRRVNFVVTHY